MDLVHRSIKAIAWNSSANVFSVVVLFVRSVLLARWLPVEVFGIYAGAQAIILLTSVVAGFGMATAFLNREAETEDEDQAAAVYFALLIISTVVWALLVATGSYILTEGPLLMAILTLVVSYSILNLAAVPQQILVRRVVHRRLALIRTSVAVGTTLVALILAWQGVTLWALLATDLVAAVITILLVYTWRPVWKPHLSFHPPAVRYFLRLGWRNLVANTLARLIDRVDDLWTGFYLGAESLGFYSRAYTFARYPRVLIAMPVNQVVVGTFAELKTDRLRLSQAFFRTSALLVRAGFLAGGLLVLIAPEFISILLGDKWMPMLGAFRLMLIFTLLDPLRLTIDNLFAAIGRPEKVAVARIVQIVILIAGLFLLGFRLDISGVALAVDGMLIAGLVIQYLYSREFVDISLRRLFIVPCFGLLLAYGLSYLVILLPGVVLDIWLSAALKTFTFIAVFIGIQILFEGRMLYDMLQGLHSRLRS